MASSPPTRRRDAAATRKAILASAREAFARAGYDGAGVREIAANAGVTAMLVNRYFGSKEKLFAEVVAETMAPPSILGSGVLEAPAAGEQLAGAIVELTQSDRTPLDGFLIMVHSASSKRAAEIGREQIEQFHHKTATDALHGEHAPERAALLLSLVLGVQIMRQMLGLSSLAKADPAVLKALLTPLFQQLIEGEPPRDGAPEGAAKRVKKAR
ncbi:transcriptional regulator, TetR family protein [Minicystis rosea]|nr:transcriptional regulator, TetR family protein [Minicystis rosea]